MDNVEKIEDVPIDSLLQKEGGYSVETEIDIKEYPLQFKKIHEKIIKSISLYLQLLWSANPHGKTIVKYNVLNILENAKMLFATRYHTDNIYVTRHIAADLREIGLFSGFNIKRYLKNIDVERLDIKKRLELNDSIVEYFSTIVHFNYISGYNSYGKIKTINEELKILGFPDIEIPNTEQDYLEDKIFDKIFEQVSIIFVMNHYEIFSEFLFDEDE